MRKRIPLARRNIPKVFIDKNLIHVENPPIKKILIDRYQSYLDKIHKLKTKIEFFELQDEPAYETWMKKNFCKALEQIQLTKAQSSELQNRFTEAELIALRYGISLEEAYKRVLAKVDSRKEKPKADPTEDPEETEFKDSFEKTFGFRPEKSQKEGSCLQKKSLKETYRFLARKLHPDMRSVSHPHWDDLWFEAQFAYQTCNLDDLNRVALIVEAHESVHSDNPHLSTVLKVNIVFERQIHQLQNQIKSMERSPAWEFAQALEAKNLKPIISKIKNRLDLELAEAKSELKHYQTMEKDYRPSMVLPSTKATKSSRKSAPSKSVRGKGSQDDYFSS